MKIEIYNSDIDVRNIYENVKDVKEKIEYYEKILSFLKNINKENFEKLIWEISEIVEWLDIKAFDNNLKLVIYVNWQNNFFYN